jgi:DNA-binding phage protein
MSNMALTLDFKKTTLARVQRDPRFRNALLKEGIETLLAGDVDTGKPILRDYIRATVGFEQLGAEAGSSPKSLIRMFGPSGNPQARNLFAVISHLQREPGLTLHVTARAQRAGACGCSKRS